MPRHLCERVGDHRAVGGAGLQEHPEMRPAGVVRDEAGRSRGEHMQPGEEHEPALAAGLIEFPFEQQSVEGACELVREVGLADRRGHHAEIVQSPFRGPLALAQAATLQVQEGPFGIPDAVRVEAEKVECGMGGLLAHVSQYECRATISSKTS